jgi:hypothetical protein
MAAEEDARHDERQHAQHKKAGHLVDMAKSETLIHHDSKGIAWRCGPAILAQRVARRAGFRQIRGSLAVQRIAAPCWRADCAALTSGAMRSA